MEITFNGINHELQAACLVELVKVLFEIKSFNTASTTNVSNGLRGKEAKAESLEQRLIKPIRIEVDSKEPLGIKSDFSFFSQFCFQFSFFIDDLLVVFETVAALQNVMWCLIFSC